MGMGAGCKLGAPSPHPRKHAGSCFQFFLPKMVPLGIRRAQQHQQNHTGIVFYINPLGKGCSRAQEGLESRQALPCPWPEISVPITSCSSTTQRYQQADSQPSISRTAAPRSRPHLPTQRKVQRPLCSWPARSLQGHLNGERLPSQREKDSLLP